MMSLIQITDNHKPIALNESDDRYKSDFASADDFSDAKLDIENLIANKTIDSLCKNNPNLLVFPQALGYHGDDIGEGVIISLYDNKISTNNIMGFVGVNQTQIDIRSRFAKINDEDYFLHYMLQKVFSINLFDIQHTISKQPIFDFLLYLFPHFLKKALSQGLYKKYKRFGYNDANVRGPIDVDRHIRQNIPFKGTVAYSTREHSYDNEITQLVRHTIEFIRAKAQGSTILNNDLETKECVSQIVMATQTYNVRERNKIINQNLRPVRHPYFSAYTDLQKICLQILRHESIKYGQEKDKVYGILFDGAWLWEEYLNKIFEEKKLAIKHPRNKTGENGIQIYIGSNKYYPDFYKKGEDDIDGIKSIVLDAKYKRLGHGAIKDGQNISNKISICRDDLFQMITYMHTLPAKHCALLYPIEPDELQNANINKIFVSDSRKLKGYGGEIYGYGIKISAVKGIKDFWDEMDKTEKKLCEDLKNVL